MPMKFKNLPIKTKKIRREYGEQINKINISYENLKQKILEYNNENDMFIYENMNGKIYIENATHKIIYALYNSLNKIENKVDEKWKNFLFGQNTWTINTNPKILKWTKIWINIHDKINTYLVQSSIWEMINISFICPTKLHKMFQISKICVLCNVEEENEFHIFMRCETIIRVYNHFNNILQLILDKPIDDEEMAFGIYEESTPRSRLRNYITFTIRHITFKMRPIKINNPLVASEIVIKRVRNFIKKDLGEKMLKAIQINNVENFQKTYLIDNVIGNIENNIVLIAL